MKRYLSIHSLMMLLIVASCDNDSGLMLQKPTAVQHNEFEESIIQHTSLLNDVSQTRNSEDFTVSPFIFEGDTVMYVIQYSDGWELISADTRYVMSVMKEETGTFEMKSMSEPLKVHINDVASDIYRIKSNNLDLPTDSSWNWLNPVFEKDELSRINEEKPDYNNGKWDLIDIIDKGNTITDIPHIITTKWGQGVPWNAYVPYSKEGNRKQPVGCVAVAFGQYAYFLHFKEGKPTYVPSGATYMSNSNSYTFYGSEIPSQNNLIWINMARNADANSTNSAALLLGYIAKVINTDFSESSGSGSSATPSNAINKYLNPSTGDNYVLINSSTSKIISELNKGYPVMAGGKNPAGIGHRFIIDSYYCDTHTYEYVYGWNGKTLSGNDPNLYNLDGSIAVYGIQKTNTLTEKQEYFRMNWGYAGYGDNVLSTTSCWAIEKNTDEDFSNNRTIIVKQN